MRRLVTLLALACALPALGVLAPAAAAPWDDALSSPREDPYYPKRGDSRIDVLHYGLDLRWSPRTRTLRGTATIDLRIARETNRIKLDLAHGLKVDGVLVDGDNPWGIDHAGDHLRITPVDDADVTLPADSRHVVVVRYHGTPRTTPGPAERLDVVELGWTTTRSGQVWTMQEPFGAFTWYPVNDHPSDKAFYDATLSVPKPWTGVFNGRLVARESQGDRRVTSFHLDEPAASYLVTLAIGPYEAHRTTGPHDLAIVNWLPRNATDAEIDRADRIGSLISWLEDHLGPYPFSRAGVLAVPGGSAMETQTLVTLNRSLLGPGPFRRAVVLHELAHQWYGDTVTPDSWKDLWMNEGWAMYTQLRWEADHGLRTMGETRRNLADLDQDLRDDDGPPGAYDKGEFGDSSVYYCTALMIDQLQAVVGNAAFRDLWSSWPSARALSNSRRSDYIDWASDRTGHDLGPLITEWLTSETTPELVPR